MPKILSIVRWLLAAILGALALGALSLSTQAPAQEATKGRSGFKDRQELNQYYHDQFAKLVETLDPPTAT